MYDPMRADRRPIDEKALGLIFAMDDAAAERLHRTLSAMAAAKSRRAAMFWGAKADATDEPAK
ncbi:MAG: hypothetical protein VKL39_24750 [Leptolyngbyaceae bacterium]|nr:hypothetical protein [Leptolyngbyaceae bacterium]